MFSFWKCGKVCCPVILLFRKMNQERKFEHELRAQGTLVLLWRAGNFGAAFIFLMIGWNGHGAVMLFALVIQSVFNLIKWPPIKAELVQRRRVIAFKQQIDNLYIFSESPDGDDDLVASTFNETVAMLKNVGNEHEVRVHMAIFQDVAVFTSYTDANGRTHSERTWRDSGSATETWEQYTEWRERFYREDRDKRLRQLRTDSRGFEWVNKHYFKQDVRNN